MSHKDTSIKAPTKWETLLVRSMILLGIVAILNFLIFFFRPELRGYLPLFVPLAIILVYGALKKLYLWYHYFSI
ncbi:MAG: hypothetical protein WA913_07880, partial [Pricia sp.]